MLSCITQFDGLGSLSSHGVQTLINVMLLLWSLPYHAVFSVSGCADKASRLSATRQVGAYLPRFGTKTDKGGAQKKVDLVEKVFVDLAKRFKERPGGYTRIIKVAIRRGDAAPMSIIEWVS